MIHNENDDHETSYRRDDAGWVWVDCTCGWSNGPFPGQEEAVDEAVDHRVEAALS